LTEDAGQEAADRDSARFAKETEFDSDDWDELGQLVNRPE
jgi:hypothetical protein